MRTEPVDVIADIRKLSNDAVSYFESAQKNKGVKKKCPYAPGFECTGPGTFEICKDCPFGYIPCLGDIMKNLYKKIIGISISLLNREIRLMDLFGKSR